MRKADYATLAAIIKKQRADADQSEANSRASGNHENAEFNAGKVVGLKLLASEFSKTASVNRAEFLRACGIEP